MFETSAPLVELAAAAESVAAGEWWRLSDAELLAAAKEYAAVEARVAAGRLGLLAEIDTRGAATATGAPTTASWLRAATRREARAAKREVRLAGALAGSCAVTRDALASGRVSVAAAEIVVDAIGRLPRSLSAAELSEAERTFVGLAERLDERDLRSAVRHLDTVLDPDGIRALEAEERRQRQQRELRLVPDSDGWWHLAGRLDPISGEMVKAVLDPLSAPRPSTADGPDLRSAAQRRADALVDLVRIGLASHLVPAQGGAQVTLLLTVDEATLRHEAETAGVLPSGQVISPAELRRVACDAGIVPAVMGGASQPLDLGRTRYTCPPHLRRALILRDDGCAFPGCDRPWQWTDAHHIVFWSDGGTTSLDHLALLCGHHHRVIHDRHSGWTIDVRPGRAPAFVPPAWIQELSA